MHQGTTKVKALPLVLLMSLLSTSLFCVLRVHADASSSSPVHQSLKCTPLKVSRCNHGSNFSFDSFINQLQDSSCGYSEFNVSCDPTGQIIRTPQNDYFRVLNIAYENHSLKLRNTSFPESSSDFCVPSIRNFSINDSMFKIPPNQKYLYFFAKCRVVDDKMKKHKIPCSRKGSYEFAVFSTDPLLETFNSECKTVVTVPVDGEDGGHRKQLTRGFSLQWKIQGNCTHCKQVNGTCGFNYGQSNFTCYCLDGSSYANLTGNCTTDKQKKSHRYVKLGAGIAGACLFLIILAIVLYIFVLRRRNSIAEASNSSKNLLEGGVIFDKVAVFSYSELQRATSNFSSNKELGDGGFGAVFYGKLKDGREVAVKRMYEHNYRRTEQFINEIDILRRIRHKNLVSLYGSTTQSSKELLLVYEFIPNGTVFDHLHGNRVHHGFLKWQIRMNIAIETATALAYLHDSEIIHRDVKTTNILLDNDFCVKVADFGLSRLFPLDRTHISTAPQGTPGYVDPEYHQCYKLTNKSDVYSFGVVLIELVSSLPAVDITRDRSETNLAYFALKRIQRCAYDELIDQRLGYNTDEEVTRMTTLVADLAFRCVQQDSNMRPSMFDVLEELKHIQRNGDYSRENTPPPFSPPDSGDDLRLTVMESSSALGEDEPTRNR